MATPRFLDVFSQVVVEDELTNNLQNAILSECKLDIDERTLDIKIKSDTYITHDNQINLNMALKNALQLNFCNIKFDFTSFTVDVCKDIADELKIKNPVVNGYLNGAGYELSDNKVFIDLKHGGYNKIIESKFINDFIITVKKRFGIYGSA